MQLVISTSNASQERVLPGMLYTIRKFWPEHPQVHVVGFSRPKFRSKPVNYIFHSIGAFEDFPAHKWSDAWLLALDRFCERHFILLLDDYWLVRPVDHRGVQIAFDYMRQFENVLKFDLARDRLWVDPGRFHYDFNNYGYAGHLDLIRSRPGDPYHMSLWGGAWNRDLMRSFLVKGETAQQIELNGTNRVSQSGDDILVLGSRQGPLVHGNILQSSKNGPVFADGGWKIDASKLDDMRSAGLLKALET